MASDSVSWSTTTVPATVRGFPARVYSERRHTLAELLIDAERWSDRTFVLQGDRRLSYAEHEVAVRRGAALLSERGVGPGDTVLLAGVNSIEWVVGFWATVVAGATVALANFWWSESELSSAIASLTPALVLSDSARLAPLPEGTVTLSLSAFDPARLADRSDDGVPALSIDEDSGAMIVFTSGSTGNPKGALLSHHGIIAAQQNLLASTNRLPQEIGHDHPAVVSLLTAPLFHLGGIGPLITALLVGGEIVFLSGKFDAVEALQLIESERITVWGGVPTTVRRVVSHPDVHKYDLSSLRTVGLGGAPVPPELPELIREAFPNARKGVSQVYGMTETCGFIATASGSELLERPGTTGRPFPVVEVVIRNPDQHGIGEIVARGPSIMLGYVGDPPGSAVDADGFFATGDLGRMDSDGFLYVTGRSKDVIIRGGENIAAPHVESVLGTHPAVAEAVAVAPPHEDLGEEVGVVVVTRSPVTEEELRAYLRDKLAYFEVPSQWWIRSEELPTTAYGKPDKKALRASMVQRLAR